MIILAVITLLAVTLAGFVVLLYAVNHVADGYEDELGFHHGTEPRRQRSMAAVESVRCFENIEDDEFEATRLKQQPLHASQRAASV
jgi:hypothetical protein